MECSGMKIGRWDDKKSLYNKILLIHYLSVTDPFHYENTYLQLFLPPHTETSFCSSIERWTTHPLWVHPHFIFEQNIDIKSETIGV